MTKRLAILTLDVTTTLGPSHVHVMKGSQAMACSAMVGNLVTCNSRYYLPRFL